MIRVKRGMLKPVKVGDKNLLLPKKVQVQLKGQPYPTS